MKHIQGIRDSMPDGISQENYLIKPDAEIVVYYDLKRNIGIIVINFQIAIWSW